MTHVTQWDVVGAGPMVYKPPLTPRANALGRLAAKAIHKNDSEQSQVGPKVSSQGTSFAAR